MFIENLTQMKYKIILSYIQVLSSCVSNLLYFRLRLIAIQ